MSVKLSFGYLYDFRNPPQWRKPWEALYAETLNVIAETEKLGFEGAWLPEHHLAEDGYLPSPLTVLAHELGRQVRPGPLCVRQDRGGGARAACSEGHP